MSSSNNNEASLSALLQALAVGVRSVAPLAVGDEQEYLRSFPGVSRAWKSTQEELSLVLQEILEDDQALVWDRAVELCDALVDQAEAYLTEAQTQQVRNVSVALQQRSKSAYRQLMDGLIDMPKPQLRMTMTVDHRRDTMFTPSIRLKHHALTPLDITPRDGRPMDTKYDGNVDELMDMTHVIGPTQHIPHPYRMEITTLSWKEQRWIAPPTRPKISVVENLVGNWIDTEEQLQQMVHVILNNTITTIAVDLEAHNHRSFTGMVCLLQLSFKHHITGDVINYLIDTLQLWNCLSTHLATVFTNPNIVKVMHGADSDVTWLQRDFGIYIVNLFDTGRAARLLKLSSAGYAHLLDTYAGIQADKTHQLSDWRQRPLPDAMHKYAVMDTHYLLDIYEMLKYDITHHSSPEVTLERVWDTSKAVCLIRYDKEVFRPNGYKSLISQTKKTQSHLTDQQELVLKALYDWRDATARDCDESTAYVCTNQALLRLALACPKNVSSLQTMFHPIPPLVLRFAQEILKCIQQAMKKETPPMASAPTSAFSKPVEIKRSDGILSPVLGTEALYKQAGWMTPSHLLGVAPSTDDDVDDEEGNHTQPRKLLLIDPANKEYKAVKFTSHSLELKKDTVSGDNCTTTAKVEAQLIRSTLHQQDMFGLISPANTDADDDDEDDIPDVDSLPDDDNFEIPKSMREIYKISNRNRRNKNVPSPVNVERSVVDTLAVDTIEGAEALLGDYFTSKRQRTKGDGNKTDAEFMQEIGWLESKEEMDSLLLDHAQEETPEFDRGATPTEPFDYSTVGTIGVYSATASANPFFTGVAVSGSVVQGRSGRSTNDKRRPTGGRGGRGGRGRQGERPEKIGGGRSHVYKQRK